MLMAAIAFIDSLNNVSTK